MNPVLKLLLEGGNLTTAQIAQVANLSVSEVEQHLEQLKKDKVLLGWRPVLDLSNEAAAAATVRAVIEAAGLTGSPNASRASTRWSLVTSCRAVTICSFL
jgi:DNA-binding Lrp family transcriptional regulator